MKKNENGKYVFDDRRAVVPVQMPHVILHCALDQIALCAEAIFNGPKSPQGQDNLERAIVEIHKRFGVQLTKEQLIGITEGNVRAFLAVVAPRLQRLHDAIAMGEALMCEAVEKQDAGLIPKEATMALRWDVDEQAGRFMVSLRESGVRAQPEAALANNPVV